MNPRPRSFDESVALRRAKDLFWAFGYEATSMQNLVDHMGIGRQSLYNTFGDKHRLYLRALELYQSENHESHMQELASPTATLEDVRAFALGVARRLGAQEDRRACFLMNALMELSPWDEAVATIGRRHRELLLQHMESACERSSAELRPGITPAVAALLLAHLVMGLSQAWKSGAAPEELIQIVEAGLESITAAREAVLAR